MATIGKLIGIFFLVVIGFMVFGRLLGLLWAILMDLSGFALSLLLFGIGAILFFIFI